MTKSSSLFSFIFVTLLISPASYASGPLPLSGSALTRVSTGPAADPVAAERGHPDIERAIDAVAQSELSAIDVPGLSLVIMRGHKVVVAKGYGVTDLVKGTLPSAYTVYRIASVSKQFTAAAVMKLVEQGKVVLDDPVTKYLNDYQATAPIPTVRMLLNQTAGLPDLTDFPEIADADKREPVTIPQLAAMISTHPTKFPAGEWWAYSNSNYTLLAALIEKVSGKAYDEFLSQYFFVPLGLHSTGSCESIAQDVPQATGYETAEGKFVPRHVDPKTQRFLLGSGSLCSTAMDVAKWMRSLVDGRAVSAKSFRQMTTPATIRGESFTAPYGFGLSMIPLAGQPAVSHTGVTAGFSSMVAYFPKDDLILSLIVNGRHSSVQHSVKALARTVLHLDKPTLKDVPITSSALLSYSGTYDDGMFRMRTYAKDGRLYLEGGPSAAPLFFLYQGGGEFASPAADEFRIRFQQIKAGHAERFVFEWAELYSFARRVP